MTTKNKTMTAIGSFARTIHEEDPLESKLRQLIGQLNRLNKQLQHLFELVHTHSLMYTSATNLISEYKKVIVCVVY